MALLAPAASQAAVTIGQVNPNNPGAGGNCDPLLTYTQSGTTGVVLAAAPSAGVITSWSTRAGTNANQQAALKTISQTGSGGGAVFTIQATSAIQTLTPGTLNTFTARIPIQAGQRIGYFIPGGPDDNQACNYNGVQNQNEIAAGANNGTAGSQFTNTDGSSQKLLNLEAKIETDADGDGFGDETQDSCLGASGANNGCPAGTNPTGPGGSDTTKPALGRLSFARGSFAAASSGPAYTSQRKRKRKPPVGSKFSFTLSETSAVKFTVERKTTGRRVNRRCKTRTRSNRRKPRCTLYKKVTGSFIVNGTAGKNTITFRGRINGRKLRTGSYRMTGTATDPAKNASAPARATFRIVK